MTAWLALVGAAEAKSWCASPVVAHEWGVAVLRPEGGLVLPAGLPDWFERSGVAPVAGVRVRDLPADSGVRTLPVVQFWRGDDRPGDVPVAVDVGFALGTAAVWWPPVDVLSLGEPARQLRWEALTLGDAPAGLARTTPEGWVQELRRAPGALWVNRGPDSERFLFYEGRTREEPALVSVAGPGGVRVRNRSDWPVHDVWVVSGGKAAAIDELAPGAEVTVRPSSPLGGAAAEFRARWVASESPALRERRAGGEGCVMMRDPAVPVTAASGHALYGSEVDAMLGVWGERLFSAGDHLFYREDPAAVDALMPVSLYTDMLHWLEWRRLSVVLVEP